MTTKKKLDRPIRKRVSLDKTGKKRDVKSRAELPGDDQCEAGTDWVKVAEAIEDEIDIILEKQRAVATTAGMPSPKGPGVNLATGVSLMPVVRDLAKARFGAPDSEGPAARGNRVTNPRETSSVTVPLVTPNCFSYLPGHGTHYIAALRVHVDTPRDPVTVLDADADGWITFRDQESREIRWWHHDAPRSAALWRAGAPFARVRDSHFLVARGTVGSESWIYCNDIPSPCVRRPSTDPIEALKNEGGFVMAVKGPDPTANLRKGRVGSTRSKSKARVPRSRSDDRSSHSSTPLRRRGQT